MCGTLLNLYPTIPILILCQKVMILGIIECLFFRGLSASSFVPRLNYTPFHQYCNSVAKDLQTLILMVYNGSGGDRDAIQEKTEAGKA